MRPFGFALSHCHASLGQKQPEKKTIDIWLVSGNRNSSNNCLPVFKQNTIIKKGNRDNSRILKTRQKNSNEIKTTEKKTAIIIFLMSNNIYK